MVNILMLSKWHVHADGYAQAIQAEPDARISCVWDEDEARGRAWAESLGVPFEADLGAALARADVDAVIVETPTVDHREVMVKAAEAGKHIFTEKTLAITLEDCRAIADAVAKSGVKFCISFPHLTTPLVQLCREAIDEGWIGKVQYMRMRKAHDGALKGWLPEYWYDVEKAGGGAMMDLGCHPMYTASYLLGKPVRIASVFTNEYAPEPADDNAVSVVEFEGKAIAVLETAFITPFRSEELELFGTEGAIICQGDEVRLRRASSGNGWLIPDRLPAQQPTALRQWLDGITKGTPIPFDMERAIALTELLENAYRSDAEQRIVKIR